MLGVFAIRSFNISCFVSPFLNVEGFSVEKFYVCSLCQFLKIQLSYHLKHKSNKNRDRKEKFELINLNSKAVRFRAESGKA